MLQGISKALQRLALLKGHLFKKKETYEQRLNKLKERAKEYGFHGDGFLTLCTWANVNSEEKFDNILNSIEAFINKRDSSIEVFRYSR